VLRPRTGAAARRASTAFGPRLRFDHLTVEQGLSDNWMQCVFKDSAKPVEVISVADC
jgi:hypothetical protein